MTHIATRKNIFFPVNKINGPLPWPLHGVRTANYSSSHQNFARKFEKKPLLLNSTQRIFNHHDFTKKLEQNTPKHLIFANCCFSSASISTLPSVSFQSYMTVIFRLYKIFFFLLPDLSVLSLFSSWLSLLFILHILYHSLQIRRNSLLCLSFQVNKEGNITKNSNGRICCLMTVFAKKPQVV